MGPTSYPCPPSNVESRARCGTGDDRPRERYGDTYIDRRILRQFIVGFGFPAFVQSSLHHLRCHRQSASRLHIYIPALFPSSCLPSLFREAASLVDPKSRAYFAGIPFPAQSLSLNFHFNHLNTILLLLLNPVRRYGSGICSRCTLIPFLTDSSQFSLTLLALVACITSYVLAVSPIEVRGADFVNSVDGSRFQMIGVA